MIELVRDLRVINVLAKFENDPWKIMDVRVLTGLVCPAARPLGVRQYPGALKGCGVKMIHGWSWNHTETSWPRVIETLSALLALCEEKPTISSGFPRGCGAFVLSLMLAWTNCWTDSRVCRQQTFQCQVEYFLIHRLHSEKTHLVTHIKQHSTLYTLNNEQCTKISIGIDRVLLQRRWQGIHLTQVIRV